MRHLPLLLALAACQDGEDDATGFLVPGIETGATVAGLSVDFEGGVGTTAPDACLTRYGFVGTIPDAECGTELVTPLHRKTTCAAHPELPQLVDVETDAAGHTLHHAERYDDGKHYSTSWSATYDAAGRLVVRTSDPNMDGVVDSTYTVTQYDAAGRPLAATSQAKDIELPGYDPLAGTDVMDATYRYDDLGRLTGLTWRFPKIDHTFAEGTFTYDDRARTRTREIILHGEGLFPDVTRSARNFGYDVFDTEGRIVEAKWENPEGPRYIAAFRYDEAGRMLTKSWARQTGNVKSSAEYVAHMIYDCK